MTSNEMPPGHLTREVFLAWQVGRSLSRSVHVISHSVSTTEVVDNTFGTNTSCSHSSSLLWLGYLGVLSDTKEATLNHLLLFIGQGVVTAFC